MAPESGKYGIRTPEQRRVTQSPDTKDSYQSVSQSSLAEEFEKQRNELLATLENSKISKGIFSEVSSESSQSS